MICDLLFANPTAADHVETPYRRFETELVVPVANANNPFIPRLVWVEDVKLPIPTTLKSRCADKLDDQRRSGLHLETKGEVDFILIVAIHLLHHHTWHAQDSHLVRPSWPSDVLQVHVTLVGHDVQEARSQELWLWSGRPQMALTNCSSGLLIQLWVSTT